MLSFFPSPNQPTVDKHARCSRFSKAHRPAEAGGAGGAGGARQNSVTVPRLSPACRSSTHRPTEALRTPFSSQCVQSFIHTPAVPKERLYPDRRRAQRIRPWKKSRLSTHRGGSGNVRWPVSRALCWGGAAAHVVPHSPFGRLGESGKQSSWEDCTHERGVVAHLYLQTSVIAEAVLGSLLARPLPRGWRPSGGALQDAKDSRSHSPDAFAPC